jgi:translation initiation factor IF-3
VPLSNPCHIFIIKLITVLNFNFNGVYFLNIPTKTFQRPNPRMNNRFGRGNQPADTHRINHKIIAKEVRVVTEAGEQLGILSLRDAILKAESYDLDLVEVAPTAKPPVCKIMDYGKFKYKEQKKEAEAKKKRTENVIKELRLTYRTASGDLETKLKHAREFLLEGDKVKFSMKFNKGREMLHVNLGLQKFDLIAAKLSDIATIDEKSLQNARQLYVIFAPIKVAAVGASPSHSEQQKNNETGFREKLLSPEVSNKLKGALQNKHE